MADHPNFNYFELYFPKQYLYKIRVVLEEMSFKVADFQQVPLVQFFWKFHSIVVKHQ